MKRRDAGLAMAAFALSLPGLTRAQSYPDHTLKLVVPYPPGASTDAVGRIVAQQASSGLGQQIVIDNRGGASGNIGTDLVAKSAPDGYTFGIGTDATHTANAHLFRNLPYDPLKDFAPLALAAMNPIVLVVNPAVPAKNIAELVAWVKANPEKGGFGSSGAGSPHHLSGELLRLRTGAPFLHVPYRGGAPALTDTLGGQLSMVFASAITVLQHIKEGRVRAIAVTGPRRYAGLPDVPTVAETLPDFEVTSWLAFFGPAKMPEPVTQRLSDELVKALQTPEVKKKLADGGMEVVADIGPKALAALQRRDYELKGKLIRDAGVQPE
jgi:tripartite-type tricarboxylate transporter receptor subunit TctC